MTHDFGVFSTRQLAALLLGLWQGRSIMMQGHDKGKLPASVQPRNRDGARAKEEEEGDKLQSCGHTLVTYFLQVGPTS